MAFCIWFSSLSVFSKFTHVTADINTSFVYVPEEYFRVHLHLFYLYIFKSIHPIWVVPAFFAVRNNSTFCARFCVNMSFCSLGCASVSGIARTYGNCLRRDV